MERYEKGRLVRIERFKVDVREPYMGNTMPIYVTIRTRYRSGFYSEVTVETEEGITVEAHLFNRKTSNENEE